MRIKNNSIAVYLLVLCSVVGQGCGPVLAPNELNVGAMGADITGGPAATSFISTRAKAKVVGDSINFLATDDNTGDEIGFTIQKQTAVPYTVSTPGTTANVQYCMSIGGNQCRVFNAGQNLGTLAITITQVSPTLKGSLSATTIQHGVTDSIRILSNSTFNASY